MNTLTLMGIHGEAPVHRDYFPAQSWGKYKVCKIGFRLCYTADAIEAP